MHLKEKMHNGVKAKNISHHINNDNKKISIKLNDTDEDSKLVHRRKCQKVDTLFSSFFSDASERRV